jgi:hypothetical protein
MKLYDFLTYKKYILCNTVDDIEELLNVKYSNHRKKVFYKDISVDADICYFGDSWTAIAGILPEQSWTNQLDILLGITNTNNFGIKGIGIEDILYLFLSVSRVIKMKKAIFLLPDIRRITIPTKYPTGTINHKNYFVSIIPKDKNALNALEIYKNIYSLPNEFFYDRAKIQIEMIIAIAEMLSIDLYLGSWGKETKSILQLYDNPKLNIEIPPSDKKGFDKMHPGVDIHTQIAFNYFKEIKASNK